MEDKVNTAAIVCGIVFPVLILTLIVVIVLCYRRWKKHQGDIDEENVDQNSIPDIRSRTNFAATNITQYEENALQPVKCDEARAENKQIILKPKVYSVEKRGVNFNMRGGVQHLQDFSTNLDNCPYGSDAAQYIRMNVQPHSDAMHLHFMYGKEFIEESHDDLKVEIENLTANLSKQKQTLLQQNKEIKRLETVISSKTSNIAETKTIIAGVKGQVADAKSILDEEQKKYDETDERYDDADTAIGITKWIPGVNIIAVPVAFLFKSHYKNQLEEHGKSVKDASENLNTHQTNLESKEEDLKTCIKDREEAERTQKRLQNSIQDTKKELDKKTKEMIERTNIQVLIRQIFNSATVITGKAKVLKNETRGAYSCEPIQDTLNELITDLNKLSKIENNPIRGCNLPALMYRDNSRRSLDNDVSRWI